MLYPFFFFLYLFLLVPVLSISLYLSYLYIVQVSNCSQTSRTLFTRKLSLVCAKNLLKHFSSCSVRGYPWYYLRTIDYLYLIVARSPARVEAHIYVQRLPRTCVS